MFASVLLQLMELIVPALFDFLRFFSALISNAVGSRFDMIVGYLAHGAIALFCLLVFVALVAIFGNAVHARRARSVLKILLDALRRLATGLFARKSR